MKLRTLLSWTLCAVTAAGSAAVTLVLPGLAASEQSNSPVKTGHAVTGQPASKGESYMLSTTGNSSQALAKASNAFGFDLLNKLADQSRKNVFISPLSIATALSMTAMGAKGETLKGMLAAMHLQDNDTNAVSQAFASLLSTIESSDPDAILEVADAIFADRTCKLEKSFVETSQTKFKAEARTANFSEPSAVTEINDWVSKKTHDKIKTIVKQLSPVEVAVLLNAVYFKGKWKAPFDAKKTENRDFHLVDGQSKSVLMMNQSGKFPYFTDNGLEAIELPYGKGRFAAYIFLPPTGKNLAQLQTELNQGNWEQWMSKLREQRGSITMPKFRIEWMDDLKHTLVSLGMSTAFGNADFSGIHVPPPPLQIGRVLHKTYVDVDEEGTEAAAVTAVVMRAMAMRIEPAPFNMVVDRPFLFVIADKETGTLLFLGSIYDPSR